MRLLLPSTAAAFLLGLNTSFGNNDDRFSYNYGSQDRTFGLEDWDQVSCDDLGQCLGWSDGYESRRGWDLTENQCRWCPLENGPNCTHHRQSPINLKRSHGIPGHENESICKDGHWMAHLPGSCKWKDIIDNDSAMLRNNFVIDRHALQIMQPLNAAGDLQCERQKFPRIDFSFGYPEFWLLYQTEVKTPSEHAQEGKQYDAEIQLDHVYEVNRKQREIGKVAIFLDGHASASRWDFLDKLICQWREIEDKTREDCCLESVPPYPGCRNPSRPACGAATAKVVVPDVEGVETTTDANFTSAVSTSTTESAATTTTKLNTAATSTGTTTAPVGIRSNANETFDCAAYPNVNFLRMCKENGCCQTPRGDGNFCHGIYDTFGDDMPLACSQCCETPKEVGPPAPEHGEYTRIECSSISQSVSRMCRRGGCCDGSNSTWCEILRTNKYTKDKMRSVCWYCCSEPRDIGRGRNLLSHGGSGRGYSVNVLGQFGRDGSSEDDFELNEVGEENRQDETGEVQRRLINFDDVQYLAYEWLSKVNTEYYFRYIGTQSVPPCFSTVHWRVMKDPIQVHPDQITELQRLLAWRIAPADAKFNACLNDTAGRSVAGSNGNKVKVNRPLQAENPLHQVVYCECKDWPSKSLDDQQWCNITNITRRFYEHPYSFDTNGEW